MGIRGLTTLVALCMVAFVTACGGGSGRQGTDLVVSAAGPAAAVPSGQQAVFAMTVRNAGSNAAASVTLTNVLSNQLVPVSVTCAASGGATCPDAPSLVMTVPSLPAGGALVFSVTTQLTATASGTIGNTMSATFADETDRGNNTATASGTAVSTVSNLVVSGAGPGGSVTGGGSADFVVTVRNDGPDASSAVRFVNNVGSFLVVRPGGVGCVASGGGICPAVLGPTMDLDTLPAGASLTFTIGTTVSPGVNGTVTNTFQASADTDLNRADNSFTATATVVTPQSGVFATGVGPAATVAGGGSAVFTMTVGNAGPDLAPSVSIVDNVGSNLTFTGVTCSASGGAICPATLGPVMTATNMPAGGALVFTVTTQVAAGTSGTLTNTLTVSADNDTSRSDNIATAVATAATPRASLVVGGSGPAQPVAGGETALFTMTVANSGPDAATNLRVVNTVGGNLTFTGATCVASAPAVCPASSGVVTDVGTLAVGGRLTFTVSAVVAPGTNGAITNTLQASADNAFSPGGNTAVAVGQAFTARSSLAITAVGPSDVPSGTGTSFVMTLANDGPQPAASVRLINTVGGNLTLTGVTCRSLSAGANCPATTGATMDLADLPVGGRLEFTVGATVALGTQGAIINTLNAVVTSGTRSETTAVAVGSAYSNNLAVTGAAPAGPLVGGAVASFTMTVANSGPGPALNVAVENQLGAGLVAAGDIGCTASGAQCPAAPAATMTIPLIPAGGSLSFTVPVTVVAGTSGTVTDRLSASAAGDARLQDNAAVASVAVVSPDLSVSQSGATQIVAGTSAVFTAVVSNPTTASATGLALTSSVSATDPRVPLGQVQIVCTPGAGATCPALLGPSMTVPSLPAGRSLTFTIVVPAPAAARGTITSSFALSAAGDPDASNNQASNSTAVVDPRNGLYKAFAADGRAYDLTIDFDAGSYTMVGGTTTQQRSFSAAGSDGKDYVVAGAQRLRVATDLIVGGHDFGGGALPYVAARLFGSQVAETVGTFNLVTRTVPATGAATTSAAVATITGNQLLVCQSDDGYVYPPGTRCPAGKQRNYVLSVASNVYTATEVGGAAESFQFLLARSDASKLLIGALPAGSASGKLRIALQDAPSLIGGTLAGASTSGSWIDTLTLTGSSYAASGGAADTATASLVPISGTGVGAMLAGSRNGDVTQPFWVMQSSPLVIAFGDFTATTGVVGLLQVALP